jgi:hypothetical protein
MRWAGHVVFMEKKRNACRVLVGRPVGGHRRRCENNIKIDVRLIGWGGMDWFHLAQDRDQ